MAFSPVYLFYPNLIGYVRIITGMASFWYATSNPWYFLVLYSVSGLLDAFDGHAARYFNQSTKFGAVLDMVTDRASTACLWVTLSQLYPEHALIFQGLLALDIMSHFARLFATMSGGSSSHKNVDASTNIFLRYYYGNRIVLFVLCMGQEATFVFLYLLSMVGKQSAAARLIPLEYINYAYLAMLPLGAIKQFMNLVQFWQSMVDIVAIDDQQRAAATEHKETTIKKESPANGKTKAAPGSPRAKKASKKSE